MAKRLTLDQVDALVEEYEALQADLERAKQGLIAATEVQGVAPPTATASKRLQGTTRSVMVTWGSVVTIDEKGVGAVREYLEAQGRPEIFPALFTLQAPAVYVPPPPKHRVAGDAVTVLAALGATVGKRFRDRVTVLYAAAVWREAKSPALKIEAAK